MSHTVVNPWTWQDDYGFVQATVFDGPPRMIFCAGQASVDTSGQVTHLDDPVGQFLGALDNLEVVLADAGATLADVVRLNYYVTDARHYQAALPALVERLAHRGCRTASTMLQVEALATPDLMVEIEATAVTASRGSIAAKD